MKYSNIYTTAESKVYDDSLRQYMYLIYKNMGISLLISGLIAFFVGNNATLLNFFFSNMFTTLIVQLAPLFLIFNINKSIFNGSISEARNKLFLFSALMGLSLSTIFVIYTKQNITSTFLITAGMFGCMSLYGYTTKKDLSSLQSFLFMGVVGILLASIVNIFLKSGTFSFGISCIAVLIFTLYTAFDIQNLKKLHTYVSLSSDYKERIAVMGALQLYLDFINIFTSLLHIMGSINNRSN